MSIKGILFGLLLSCLWTAPLSAAMTGGSFTIFADTFSFTGPVSTTGDTFVLTGTGGEVGATSTSGGSFVLNGGFQAMDQGILSYSVSPSSVSLSSITNTSVSSADTVITVSADSDSGYSVVATEDGNLRSGSDDMNDVTDGSVTAGSEEYGIRTSGGDGVLSSDTAISGSLTVASAAGRSVSRATTVSFRASAGSGTVLGSYSHIVTFTVTVNP
jgi:hypothetical protein